MRILSSKPVLRWAAPLAFVLVIGGTGLIAATASADKKLPTMSAQELLVAVQQAKVDGLSGTVVQRADLGIPEIPGIGGADSSEFGSLVSGTHTLRVRYSGPDKARLAVHGTYGETDIFMNSRDVWIWSSRDQKATHRTLTAEQAKNRADTGDVPADVPKTPGGSGREGAGRSHADHHGEHRQRGQGRRPRRVRACAGAQRRVVDQAGPDRRRR